MPEQQNPKNQERVPERQRELFELGSESWRCTFVGNKGVLGKGIYNLVITSTEKPDTRIFRMNEFNASGDLVGGFRGETRAQFKTPFKLNAIDFNGATSLLSIQKRGNLLNGSLALNVPSKRFAISFTLEPFVDQSGVGDVLASGGLVVSGQVVA